MGTVEAGFGGVLKVTVLILIILAVAGSTTGQAVTKPKASALFAFGDSYADTGNINKNFSSWKPPYGVTWPGYPDGRFSNGHVQTDYLADLLGLSSPIPIAQWGGDESSIEDGTNLALGGSGVTFALGQLPLGTQVDTFELFLRSLPAREYYTPAVLADSVTLISNVGNDYSPTAYTTQELVVVIQQVVEGIALAIGRLYDLGLRNVLVANLPPIDCVPGRTIVLNYTRCLTSLAALIAFQNNLLEEAIAELNTRPFANFIILDEQKAFSYILNNTAQYGIEEPFMPCCRPISPAGSCGDVDLQGKPLYTVCADPGSHTYWDAVHPVESTWKHVIDLFANQPGFVIGATNLETWLYQNSLVPALPPGVSSGPIILPGAVGQLEAAYEALISEPDYAESLGLLQAINLYEYLTNYPDQIATIFLPNYIAYFSVPESSIYEIYGQDQVVTVIDYHVVNGYFDSTQLSSSAKNLTTISGLQLLVNPTPTGILVGPAAAVVVRPDLYKVAGQVVVHGIDKLLIPPTLP